MPKPGKSISMTTHSRYGMIHPFAFDGRTENRGYIVASYNKAYQIPLNEEVIDECFMREYGNWLRDIGRCAGGADARPHSRARRACVDRVLRGCGHQP
jgi:hypothetical protein